MSEKRIGKLVDLPAHNYAGKLACPACYAPVNRGRRDGHCDDCLHDKTLFPVNYRRRPKPKEEDEEEQYATV